MSELKEHLNNRAELTFLAYFGGHFPKITLTIGYDQIYLLRHLLSAPASQ